MACYQAGFNLGTGPTSFTCYQSDSCYTTIINGGTGTVNLTCGAVSAGDDDSCFGLTMNQNNAILTETDAEGTYYNFACLPGLQMREWSLQFWRDWEWHVPLLHPWLDWSKL